MNNKEYLIPLGGRTDWIETCRDFNSQGHGFNCDNSQRIEISNDTTLYVERFTQDTNYDVENIYKVKEIPLCKCITLVKTFKNSTNESEIHPDETFEIYYPYEAMFDKQMLEEYAKAMSFFVDQKCYAKLNKNDKHEKLAEKCQEKLVNLMCNGSRDKDAINKILNQFTLEPYSKESEYCTYFEDAFPTSAQLKKTNNTEKQLIPSDGIVGFENACKKYKYKTSFYRGMSVDEVYLTEDSYFTIDDCIEPFDLQDLNQYAENVPQGLRSKNFTQDKPLFTCLTFYKSARDYEDTHMREYPIFYPYGSRFDNSMLYKIGIALNNLINEARAIPSSNLFLKEEIYEIEKQLIKTLLNGTSDPEVVNKTMNSFRNKYSFLNSKQIKCVSEKYDYLPKFNEVCDEDNQSKH